MHHPPGGRLAVRRLTAPVLALALAQPAAGLAQELTDLPERPQLMDFLRVAEARSPGLDSRRALWRAEAEGIRAAGSFPDPVLSVGTMFRDVETRVGPQKESVALVQRLPWFGKRALSRESARAAAGAAEARYADARLALRRDVTLAWYELYWIARAVEIADENLELLVSLEGVVREKYRASAAEHADLVRVQVELGVVEDRFRSLQDRLRPARAAMNALLRRPPDAPVPLPESLPPLSAAPPEGPVLEALRSSPDLRALDHGVERERALARLAERSPWPDWTVGLKWIRVGEALDPSLPGSGRDVVMADVSVELPLFRGKHTGAIREARERVTAARSERVHREDERTREAMDVLYRWRDAGRRAELYGGALVPKARRSLDAARVAYRTGKGAFQDLLDAQRMLLDLELENERARTDRGRNAAELHYLTGGIRGEEGSP